MFKNPFKKDKELEIDPIQEKIKLKKEKLYACYSIGREIDDIKQKISTLSNLQLVEGILSLKKKDNSYRHFSHDIFIHPDDLQLFKEIMIRRLEKQLVEKEDLFLQE